LAVIAIVGASCSSDFSRLDDPFVTATNATSNQRGIILKSAGASQPYPGDVDPINTASTTNVSTIGRSARVARRKVQPSQPYPGDAVSRRSLPKYNNAAKRLSKKPVNLLPQVNEGANETVRRVSPVPKKYTDRAPRLVTGSVSQRNATTAPAVNRQPVRSIENTKAGWTAAGGTRVTVRQGENLYNLARRYGVPVKEIMRVNNIKQASSVQAGQRILIPTYTYSRKSSISAPDSDPRTRAARSSMGYEGEATSAAVTVPTLRPYYVAQVQNRSQKTSRPSTKPAGQSKKSTRRMATRSTSANTHIVASGDTLGGIAVRYGTTRDAIRQANGMSSDVVRLGRKLIIPAGGSSSGTRIASNKAPAVDRIITGGPASSARNNRRITSKGSKPAAYTPPKRSAEIARRATEKGPTPDQTGVSKFRWPAHGRVVAAFGSRVNGSANDGIDISVPVGTPVKAAENGTVIYAGSELEEFGKLILLRHSGGWVSAYAYSSRNLVKRGDKIRRGQTIARSGRSGTANIPKLHFELRKDSNPVNPLRHLKRI
jgi:murein DD-endopeptidase MepM/ murein hydrolase activator NlpD